MIVLSLIAVLVRFLRANMNSRHPVWFGVGFTIVPFFVLLLGFINIHPELYRGIPGNFGTSNDARFVSIAWNADEEDDPPLEYISDSFKGLSVSTQIATVSSFWDLWNAPDSKVHYEWRYKVKNLTDTKLNIYVTYELQDLNGTIVSSADASKLAEPGETIEIEEIGQIDYGDAERVTASGWSILRSAAP
jgi:hypothetical protein